MKFKSVFFVFFISLLMVCCSEVKYYKWQTASEIDLIYKCENSKILIANRITKDKNLDDSQSLDYLFRGLDRQGSIATANFLLDTLKKMGFLAQYIDLPLANLNKTDDTLDIYTIKNILQTNNACLLISMDYFNVYFDENIQETRQESSIDYGGATIYLASRKAVFRAILRVYDNNGLIQVFDFSHEPIYHASGNTKAEAFVNISRTQNFTINWGNAFARNIINQLFPPQMSTIRNIYVNTNKDFKIAYKYLKEKEFKKAKEIYEKYIEIDNDKILKAKAIYNLAVVYELLGEPEIAISLAEQSYDIYKHDLAWSYINYLKMKRIGEDE